MCNECIQHNNTYVIWCDGVRIEALYIAIINILNAIQWWFIFSNFIHFSIRSTFLLRSRKKKQNILFPSTVVHNCVYSFVYQFVLSFFFFSYVLIWYSEHTVHVFVYIFNGMEMVFLQLNNNKFTFVDVLSLAHSNF